MKIPRLSLSTGQLLWVLHRGQAPTTRLRNEVRYLRQLGVPHSEEEVSEGRGHRLFYQYEDLIELGVALYVIHKGMIARDAATILVRERREFRKAFRQALEQQPEAGLKADWVKSRGKIIPMLAEDIHLRLHDRYSSSPITSELVGPGEDIDIADVFGVREVYVDGTSRILVPLTRIALELTAWALEAPAIRPGRAARAEKA